MELLLRDLRFALRGLRKTPLYTTIAIASLALGIGANTAIFSLFDQVLLRSLGVQHPDRLVWFKSTGPNMGMMMGPNTFSYPMYRDLADRNAVFEGVIARFPTPASMTYGGQTSRVEGELVSGNYFDVLGIQPMLGRFITREDDRTPGAHPVVVLSHGFWMSRFGGKSDILNKSIALNGTPMTVLGVAPPGFHGVEVGQSPDVFVPLMMKAQMTPTWNELYNRRALWLRVMARLKDGVSREQAEAAMNTLLKPILADELREIPIRSERFRRDFASKHLTLAPGNQGVTTIQDTFSKPLRILLAMVGLVLLIACANVANLMLARGASRQQEIAIRQAMGAGRIRLMRQCVAEAMILAISGGVCGVLVASWLSAGLLRLLPSDAGLVRSLSTNPDLRVLGFTFAVAVATGLLFGIAPAWQTTNVELGVALKERGNSVLGGSTAHWRKWLVAAQVSISVVLLIGAGLFVRSLQKLTTQNVGFATDRLLMFALDPKLSGYTQQQTIDLYSRVRDRIAALPGVRGVTMAENSLLADEISMVTISIEGYEPKENENMNPDVNWVGPNFAETLGTRIIAGRDIEDRDRLARVAVINEEMARVHFSGDNPLEHRIRLGRGDWYRIVGIMSNIKTRGLREKTQRQVNVPYGTDDRLSGMAFYVRTTQDPLSVTRAVRNTVRDAQVPLFAVKTMETQMAENVYVDRIIAALSVAFGVLATVLAGVGLYGVVAYLVSRRTREIGIRMALGASSAEVVRVVLRDIAATVGVGMVAAIGVSFALTKLVESQLYGVSSRDPIAMAAGPLALGLVTVIAAAGPALRALRIQPMRALRYE